MARATHPSATTRFQALPDVGVFEACEKRLVLSAQLLFDVLGDQALETHVEPPSAFDADAQELESHLREAHAATGLDAVRAQFGLTGSGQTVAVIDSGIAWDHVSLGGGYGPGYRVVGGWDFTEENDANPYDDAPAGFHGTHVAGIIGSDHALNTGVAPGVDLVALRVFNDTGAGQLSWVENALQWVHDNQDNFEHPITTVNLSLGTQWNSDTIPGWATLEEELKQLYDDGIVVTASAGNSFATYNSTGLSYPAASPYVLPIASVDDDGGLSDFSQRNDRVIAAPGSRILSSVPDHVLGRDGQVNDFSTASGTSMAAPYVAGASVLVRQAMEMTGWESITASTIGDHLRDTANSVFDSLTGQSYDSLNLQNAINSLLPSDTVGDNLQSAANLDFAILSGNGRIDTWLNSLTDTDVYRFTASASGTLSLDAESEWVDSLQWSIRSTGQTLGGGTVDTAQVQLIAGQSYELYVSADSSIGPVAFNALFQATGGGSAAGGSSTGNLTDLGSIRYLDDAVAAGQGYTATASQDGTFTVLWSNHDSASGVLSARNADGQVHSDATWENGQLRLDFEVRAGEQLQIILPGNSSDSGDLSLANVLQRSGNTVTVTGTVGSDDLSLNLQNGTAIQFENVAYAFSSAQVTQLQINGYGSNDSLSVIGSAGADKVDLMPTGSTLENAHVRVVLNSVEQVDYRSGGGADRVYLYDSDSNDTLTASPGRAELVGVGYRFQVQDVQRIFVHATGGGQDFAYLYDSSGDDRLSVRPQFTSMSGDGFFNYVRGFERVFAYANAGGHDTATLYDSSGADRFNTNGVSASIVGPGFSSFTRNFDQVTALATEGGNDLATLYAANSGTQWQQGSDFIRFQEQGWQREARGFSAVETYVASQRFSIDGLASQSDIASLGETDADASNVVPALDSQAQPSWLSFGEQNAQRNEWSRLSDALLELDATPAELNVLRELASVQAILGNSLADASAELIDDPELEQSVLDEAFRQFNDLF